MKATLQFNLPEDDDQYRAAACATELRGAIIEMLDYLRTNEKYTSDSKQPKIPEIRREFYEILDERGICSLFQ